MKRAIDACLKHIDSVMQSMGYDSEKGDDCWYMVEIKHIQHKKDGNYDIRFQIKLGILKSLKPIHELPFKANSMQLVYNSIDGDDMYKINGSYQYSYGVSK